MGDAVFVSTIPGADHTWTVGPVVGISGQLCTDRGLSQADPVPAVPVPCLLVPPVAEVLALSAPPPAALPPDVPVPVVPVTTVPPRIPLVRAPTETLSPGTPPLRRSQRFRKVPDRLQL